MPREAPPQEVTPQYIVGTMYLSNRTPKRAVIEMDQTMRMADNTLIPMEPITHAADHDEMQAVLATPLGALVYTGLQRIAYGMMESANKIPANAVDVGDPTPLEQAVNDALDTAIALITAHVGDA